MCLQVLVWLRVDGTGRAAAPTRPCGVRWWASAGRRRQRPRSRSATSPRLGPTTEDEQHAGHDVRAFAGTSASCSALRSWRAGDDGGRQHHADDRPPPPEDRDPAEQHDGDDGELETGAVVGAGAGEAERPEDPGERRHRAPTARTARTWSAATRMPENAAASALLPDGEERAARSVWRAAPRRSRRRARGPSRATSHGMVCPGSAAIPIFVSPQRVVRDGLGRPAGPRRRGRGRARASRS